MDSWLNWLTCSILLCITTLPKLSSTKKYGWEDDSHYRLVEPGPCTLNVESSRFTQKDFLQRYAYDSPVVINLPNNWNERFSGLTSKDGLLEHYHDKVIRLSSANTYSYLKKDVSLQTYIEEHVKPQTLDKLGNETFYWFGDNNFTEWEGLFKEYNMPPYKLPSMEGALSFGLAGAGSGVPFHFHGPGFGEVIHGKKRWFLYPPEKQPHFHPNQTTLQWYLSDYPELHPAELPMECTIEPGQVIYFPNRWWHATLNTETSVFISTFLG